MTRTWTWDRINPDPVPTPGPEPTAPPRASETEPLPLNHPRAVQRLAMLLFDHFRTDPIVHRELNIVMKHWRQYCDTGVRPPSGPGFVYTS